jgi:protein required for attachment to host cells
MAGIRIPHGTWVIVGDGRKALFLRNEGDEKFPNLTTVQLMENTDQRATHEAGTDRPGRTHQSADMRRSAMEQTDFHDLEEQRFARDVATMIAAGVEDGSIESVILVAPPRTLAVLRRELPAKTRARVLAEVNKDITNRPVAEIERTLTMQ